MAYTEQQHDVRSRMDSHDFDYSTDSEELGAESNQYDHAATAEDDASAERELDKDLEWTARKTNADQNFPPLNRAVVVPQAQPGLASLFQRAWAPDLASHDVTPDEWMQFIDHLNVCKTGSPPLQVLNLAGSIVGFVPVHYAQIAGIATNAVAIGGMVAVSKVRISRYLKRANEEYFVPRGLVARIVKQSTIHEVTGQSPEAPMFIDDGADIGNDPTDVPDFIERRMLALGDSVAPLQLSDVPAPKQEQSTLDRMTAKMNALKDKRGNKKGSDGKERSKELAKMEKEKSKELAKLEKEREKRRKEEGKIRTEAEKDLRKDPDKRAKIEKKMNKELAKLEEDDRSDEEKYLEKAGKGGKKGEKKAKRLMFIAVQVLGQYMRLQAQSGQGESRMVT